MRHFGSQGKGTRNVRVPLFAGKDVRVKVKRIWKVFFLTFHVYIERNNPDISRIVIKKNNEFFLPLDSIKIIFFHYKDVKFDSVSLNHNSLIVNFLKKQ